MKRRILGLALAALAVGLAWQTASAQHLFKHHHPSAPACEPGYQMVEEIIYQDVVRAVCKMVPETKKKWVYSWIDDPFCIHDHKHGQCPDCVGPYCRKQLVKRQIDEPCPTMRCVTETFVERVPVVVWRKVPCLPGAEPAPEKIPAPKLVPGQKMPPAVGAGGRTISAQPTSKKGL